MTASYQSLTETGSGVYSVSVGDAARITGVSPDTIRKAINELRLPAKKTGRAIRIRVSDVHAWFDSLEDAAS